MMKSMATTLVLAMTWWAGAVDAAPSPQSANSPLPYADCLRTDRINDWHIVDARTAIVRTGPRRYLISLKNDCPQLSHPPGLIFSANANPPQPTQSRICGSLGETVHSRGQPPCAIESVSLIDKARFDQLSEQAKRYRRGEDAPKH